MTTMANGHPSGSALPNTTAAPNSQTPGHPSFRRWARAAFEKERNNAESSLNKQTTRQSCLWGKHMRNPLNLRTHSTVINSRTEVKQYPRTSWCSTGQKVYLANHYVQTDVSCEKSTTTHNCALSRLSRWSLKNWIGPMRCRQLGCAMHQLCRILDRM